MRDAEDTSNPRPRPLTAWGCLWFLVKLPFVLALGVARMGVMLAVFVAGMLVAGVGGVSFGYPVDLAHALVGGPLAAVMFPIVLLIGMVGWFLPATARIYSRGGDPELEWVVPTVTDGVWFIAATWVASALLGWVWADLVDVTPAWPPMVTLAALCTLAAGVILATGGRHIAQIFVMLLSS